MEKNYLEKNIETKCAVCGIKYMTAKLNLDPCPNCGWYNDLMCEEHENEVIYRNLVSLNKAIQSITRRFSRCSQFLWRNGIYF